MATTVKDQLRLATRKAELINALVLAVLAPTDEKANAAVELADRIASGMSVADVEHAKLRAEAYLNG